MSPRLSLQNRVTAAFAAFGALLSLLLSLGMFIASVDIEQRLVDEALTAELDDYVSRRARNPHSPPPATAAVHGYVRPSERFEAAIPPEILALAPGRYQLVLEGVPYRVAVGKSGISWFYLLYNESHLAKRENFLMVFLATGVLVMTLFSAAVGRWLAGRVVSPVGELAAEVKSLRPENRPGPMAGEYAQDEVGELAQAFDAYLIRLQGFIERERAFTADVSHELRTPLAVIQGAAEVLLADVALTPSQHDRVERIARAARETTELAQALLALGRERAVGERSVSCGLEEVVRQVLESHTYLLRDKPVKVLVEPLCPAQVVAERPLLQAVIANLVRNAFTYTHEGRIRIRIHADHLTFEDTGVGIPPEELEKIFLPFYTVDRITGTGIGLSLVKRICERYGWQTTLESLPERGTIFRLWFAPPASLEAFN